MVYASGTTPYLLTRLQVGFHPTHPHSEAGILIEPPVSVPIVIGAVFATIAAAEPPLEPPGIRSSAYGFRHTPQCGFDDVIPYANSCRLSLPSITAPCALSRAHEVAS